MILALCRQDSLVSIAIFWSFGFIQISSSINSLFYQSAKGIYFFKMLEYTFDFTMTNYYGYLSFWLTPPDPFWLCVVCWWLHCFCNLGPPNFRLGYNNVHILSLTIFSTKCVFPYIWQYPLDVNGHEIKSNYNWVKCDPILERRKIR